jgi:CheY-like chemotaxis protein
MDTHLPGIDRIDLTTKLRMTSEYEKKPTVALTASAMAHDVAAAEGLFDTYDTKPVDIGELNTTLDKHLK